MKKKFQVISVLFFLFSFLQAQSNLNYESAHYSFTYPDTFTGIEDVADTFNLYRSVFNEVFRFNPEISDRTNRVVILADKASFDSYISSRIGETRNEFLFLKYPKRELSELVLFLNNTGDSGFAYFSGPSLNRQLFLQYLYSFVYEPPIWIRDGFQAYFEKLSYDPVQGIVQFEKYDPWLETAKNLNADPVRKLSVYEILSAVTGTYESARFYPLSWAFVSFLMNTEKSGYQRFLSEVFIYLEGLETYNSNTQQENTELVKNRFIRFNSAEKSDADLAFYLSGQYTFAELLQAGVSQYNGGNFAASRSTLQDALYIRPEDPMLVYYLGLVAYAEKDYAAADLWYRKALEYGADNSTVHWALALSAYADKRFAEARVYLETAKSVNPARYGEKASKILNSLPK